MSQILLILLSLTLCCAAKPATKNSEEKIENLPENTSINDLIFTKDYKKFTKVAFGDLSQKICPNLTKPDCDTKMSTNVMLGKCEVCVVKENEKCDPDFDPCEDGTVCLPLSMDDLGVNVCTKFSVEDFNMLLAQKEKLEELSADKNFQVKRKQRRRKEKCGGKKSKKCLKSRNRNKNMKKLNRLPKKFANSKKPCKAHKRYMKKRNNAKFWKPYCTKDGFYSTTKKVCRKSKCWCVDKNGFYLKKAPKNSKESC